jgi:uncharacterized protein
MIFARRSVPTLSQRVRIALWPRVSFRRSFKYVGKRLLRLKASPHSIGIGCAAGVFASITPLLGVQMALAALIAVVLRGSIVAAMLGTFVGNPISWPLIWGGTYALGCYMLGNQGMATAAPLGGHTDPIWPILFPMLIGSLPIGLAVAAVSYGVVTKAAASVQEHRNPRTALSMLASSLLGPRRPQAWKLW